LSQAVINFIKRFLTEDYKVKIDVGEVTATIGAIEGKDAESAAVTGKPVTIGYKDAAGKATGVTPTNAMPVQLSGSIPEYGWLDTDDPVTPLDPTKFAIGVEINTTTYEMTTKYWTGSAWQEVL
jgi:hypothetical protein